MKRGKIHLYGLLMGASVLLAGLCMPLAHADDTSGDFNLQITPSPLVATVNPGTKTTLDLKIYNQGATPEKLKIEPRAFTYDSNKGRVELSNSEQPAIASWISFAAPTFTVAPAQGFSQQVILNVPKDAGFSYSFALVISRQSLPKAPAGTRQINGSLAVFALLNINRPGATSKLQVVSFTSSKRLYEYLPATFGVRFRNTGNTIIQPYGNMFIQRTNSSKTSLATLTVNETKGYILPGTERTVSANWNDGFATYQSQTQPDGSTKQHLSVDWSKLSHFRIGRYTAHLVAVYNDGQHDVPIEGTVSFWVIPWRAILLSIVIVVALWLFARWRGKRRTEKAVKRALAAQAAASKAAHTEKPAEKPQSEDSKG